MVRKENISSFLLSKIYEINFHHQLLCTSFHHQLLSQAYVQGNGNNFFEHENVFQTIGIVFATERSIKSFTFIFLGFKSNFMIKKSMNDFWNDFREHLMLAASASMFYLAIGYKNKPNMKVAASNISIKIHQLFSKQRILHVGVTTA